MLCPFVVDESRVERVNDIKSMP